MAKQLREQYGLRMRQVDVYQHYNTGHIMGGSGTCAWVGHKDIESDWIEYGWPFLFGGEREGGVRDEDKVTYKECRQDENHPDLWLRASEAYANDNVIRYSC